jgi:hypothetical protein
MIGGICVRALYDPEVLSHERVVVRGMVLSRRSVLLGRANPLPFNALQ